MVFGESDGQYVDVSEDCYFGRQRLAHRGRLLVPWTEEGVAGVGRCRVAPVLPSGCRWLEGFAGLRVDFEDGPDEGRRDLVVGFDSKSLTDRFWEGDATAIVYPEREFFPVVRFKRRISHFLSPDSHYSCYIGNCCVTPGRVVPVGSSDTVAKYAPTNESTTPHHSPNYPDTLSAKIPTVNTGAKGTLICDTIVDQFSIAH